MHWLTFLSHRAVLLTGLTDIDIRPSEGLAEKLQEFYDSLDEKGIKCEK